MNRIAAAAELTWYYNVALPGLGVRAIDYSAVLAARPGWQYQDPNIEIATRARPIGQALRLCDRRAQLVLYLRFACRTGPLKKDSQGRLVHRSAEAVHEDLAGLVEHFHPAGTMVAQELWARAAVNAALVQLCRAFDAIRA